MLKSVVYYFILATTVLRFGGILYFLLQDSTNVPTPVIVVTSAMVLYGMALLIKRFIVPLRIRQLRYFFLIQTVAITFNLAYIAVACPLQISPAEMVIVGSFLDILINLMIVYFCTKQMRSGYRAVVQGISEAGRHV